jgi:hypothetical protein
LTACDADLTNKTNAGNALATAQNNFWSAMNTENAAFQTWSNNQTQANMTAWANAKAVLNSAGSALATAVANYIAAENSYATCVNTNCCGAKFSTPAGR